MPGGCGSKVPGPDEGLFGCVVQECNLWGTAHTVPDSVCIGRPHIRIPAREVPVFHAEGAPDPCLCSYTCVLFLDVVCRYFVLHRVGRTRGFLSSLLARCRRHAGALCGYGKSHGRSGEGKRCVSPRCLTLSWLVASSNQAAPYFLTKWWRTHSHTCLVSRSSAPQRPNLSSLMEAII